MDLQAMSNISRQIQKLEMYPYFDIAHAVLSALAVREDLGSGSKEFSRKHPFSCWFSTMCAVFAGSLITNFFLGESILSPLKNNVILTATVSWYFVFYAPFEIGFKISNFLPVKLVLSAMKEVYRCKSINESVIIAAGLYPNYYLIPIIVGTIKGHGSAFIKHVERLMRGKWRPDEFEILRPTFLLKASATVSAILLLKLKTNLIFASHDLIYLTIVTFFLYFKLSSLLGINQDPFVPIENSLCAIFFGDHPASLDKISEHDSKESNEKLNAKKKE